VSGARTRQRLAPMAWLAACALLATGSAEAQSTAVAAGVSAGVAASNAPEPGYRPLAASPLDDWVDPETGSTSRLASGCDGLTVELALSGAPGRNFLDVMISNDSGEPRAFAAHATTARFGSGRVRRLSGSRGEADGSDIVIDDGFWVHTVLAFPDKADFEGEDAMTVRLTFTGARSPTCTLPVPIERDRRIGHDAATHVQRSGIELHFGAGPRFFASGGIERLGGSSGPIFDLDVQAFPWVYHGLGFAIALDSYDGDRASLVAPNLVLEDPRLSGAGFLLGYVARYYLWPWFCVSYELFTGPYVFELTDGQDDGVLESGLVLPLRQRARLKARFARILDGTEFYFSTALLHLWVPSGDLGALDTAGHSLAVEFAIGIGG